MQRGILGIGRQRQAMMRHRGFELAREAQRHAEIVVQLGMVGANGEQPQIGGDRLVEAAGAMRLRRQAKLLHEAVGIAAEQQRRVVWRVSPSDVSSAAVDPGFVGCRVGLSFTLHSQSYLGAAPLHQPIRR